MGKIIFSSRNYEEIKAIFMVLGVKLKLQHLQEYNIKSSL